MRNYELVTELRTKAGGGESLTHTSGAGEWDAAKFALKDVAMLTVPV